MVVALIIPPEILEQLAGDRVCHVGMGPCLL
jgi:hypothetical protein